MRVVITEQVEYEIDGAASEEDALKRFLADPSLRHEGRVVVERNTEEIPTPDTEPEEFQRCQECDLRVETIDPYYATPCGTFCEECLERLHVAQCGICRHEFDLPDPSDKIRILVEVTDLQVMRVLSSLTGDRVEVDVLDHDYRREQDDEELEAKAKRLKTMHANSTEVWP